MSETKDNKNKISVIYQTRNDSPKHIEINRSKLLLFFIGMPLITLVGISLGIMGLIHTSPFHLIQNFQKNNQARLAISQTDGLRENLRKQIEENINLKNEVTALKTAPQSPTDDALPSSKNCPEKIVCPTLKDASAPMSNTIGLSTLSFFKPVQMQKDKTRPASMTLNDFKIVNNRDTINLQFNIVNMLGEEEKISGHIVVLLKNEQLLQIYPMNALGSTREYQINYSSGEPFSTQRFRPVDASFLKPKKPGSYVFTVFIFARNGDLIHYQSINLPVKY